MEIEENDSVAKFTLEELLDGITEDNIHEEIDFGEPVGKEIIEQ